MSTLTSRLLLTVEEAGELLGVGRTKAYELVKKKEIPCIEIGGLKRVPVRALEERLSAMLTAGIAADSVANVANTVANGGGK